MCESGEEQKCGQGDPCRQSDSRTHFQLKLKSLATINQMQNTVSEDDMKNGEDERDDVKDEGENKNAEDEEENEEEKKLHNHAKPLCTSFGAAPLDGARIGSAAADPGHVGSIFSSVHS